MDIASTTTTIIKKEENSIGFVKKKKKKEKRKGVKSQEAMELEMAFHKINELEIRLMIMGFGMSRKNIHSENSSHTQNSPYFFFIPKDFFRNAHLSCRFSTR